MQIGWSRAIVLAGLVGLIIAAPWWLYANNSFLNPGWAVFAGAVGPAVLVFPVIRQARNWTGITALCMIPFTCIGIMEIVANGGSLDAGMALAVISVTTFFAALDAGRRDQQKTG